MMNFYKFLLIFSIFISRCESSCKTVFCPSQATKQVQCDLCHECLDSGSRFCYTSDHKNCQCGAKVADQCDKIMRNGYLNYTYCHLLDDVSIPPPQILLNDEDSLSVVVPRFFQEPPFDSQKPSYLYLLATFSKINSECKSIGHIEAFHRKNEKCMFRIRLQMPKIDFSGTENYYYDDRSPLETQFSRDLFGSSANITFWTEVTVRKDEKIQNGVVSFATVIKSPKIDFSF